MKHRRLYACVLSALLAAGCAAPRSPQYWANRAVRANPALATCDIDLQRLDRSRIEAPDMEALAAYAEDGHARARGPNFPFPQPDEAVVVLRMFAAGDAHQQERTDTSTLVWKDRQGDWLVHAVDYRSNEMPIPRPPGETPYTAQEFDDLRRVVTSGQLSAQQAEALEQALADPCLDAQPDYVPMQAPMLGGEVEGCFGGVSGGVVEITRAGATRRIADGCARWRAGSIMHVLMYPRLEPEG